MFLVPTSILVLGYQRVFGLVHLHVYTGLQSKPSITPGLVS